MVVLNAQRSFFFLNLHVLGRGPMSSLMKEKGVVPPMDRDRRINTSFPRRALRLRDPFGSSEGNQTKPRPHHPAAVGPTVLS